jgi:hypothetical protein
VKVVWTREEDIQHDMYRPYWFDRSPPVSTKGMPVAWNNRFAGSSVIARWLPPAFKDGLDPDTTEGAIDLVYALPNFHVEYVRVEPPGIPTAFWRSVGPSHNVFVTESFIDELAAAAKQDPVAYRRALLDKSPRAKAVLDLAAEKAGWGQPAARGAAAASRCSSPSAATWRRWPRSRCKGRRGSRPTRGLRGRLRHRGQSRHVQAQIQSGVMFGITAALYGEITLKNGRVEQTNFDTTRCCASTRRRRSRCTSSRARSRRAEWARPGLRHRSRHRQRDLCGTGSACARCRSTEGALKGVSLMVKDSELYASTGGWGFEFFVDGDANKRLVTNPTKQCFECHQAVKNQDYVYSTYIR